MSTSGGSSGGTATLLASGNYAPAVQTTYTSTTDTAFSDIDATNIKLTFTAPSSGSVRAFLSMGWQSGGAALNGAVTARVSPAAGSATAQTVDDSVIMSTSLTPVDITGLTPGASYTVIWRFATTTSGVAVTCFAGGNTTTGHAGAAYFWVQAL